MEAKNDSPVLLFKTMLLYYWTLLPSSCHQTGKDGKGLKKIKSNF